LQARRSQDKVAAYCVEGEASMGSQIVQGRAHAAALLRTLADAADDPDVSEERLASLAALIGRHLLDIASNHPTLTRQRGLRVIEGQRGAG
jgi:hypothetical protein